MQSFISATVFESVTKGQVTIMLEKGLFILMFVFLYYFWDSNLGAINVPKIRQMNLSIIA